MRSTARSVHLAGNTDGRRDPRQPATDPTEGVAIAIQRGLFHLE
jgi:hypothetical protein